MLLGPVLIAGAILAALAGIAEISGYDPSGLSISMGLIDWAFGGPGSDGGMSHYLVFMLGAGAALLSFGAIRWGFTGEFS